MSDYAAYHALGHDDNQTPYRQTPQNGYQGQVSPSQEQGYFPPQAQQTGDGTMSPLPTRTGKKKSRHAYHNLEQPAGSSQPFNGMPQGQTTPGHPYAGQQVTPAMNQFPAPATQTAFGGGTPTVPSGPGVSAGGRVDPEQIPSVPRSRDEPAQYYLQHVYNTMEQHLPPPSSVPFVGNDQGNSTPKYARLTLNNIPSSSDALNTIALPLGLILQPLAPIQPGEQPIPVLDFGEQGPPRCRRCRTYINPFMTFRSGGNKFVCNMCTFPNDVALEYFAPTDPSGVRVDRDQRPELKLGTVEFMVPKEYWAKEPVGLRWLFLIDVGQEAFNRGFLEAFCDGILNALYGDDITNNDQEAETSENAEETRSIPLGSKVGFITFDKEIHFYNCNV